MIHIIDEQIKYLIHYIFIDFFNNIIFEINYISYI